MLTGQLPDAVRKTVNGFGWEWHKFNNHIQDSYMSDRRLFLDFIHPTPEDYFEGKLVLDAGCGMGRFLKLGAEFKCKEIIGVDMSHSVEAAYVNTCDKPNAHVVQADILALPFPTQFDYIFSLGVLHHMEYPQEGFSRLVRLLFDAGKISAWVYSEENNWWVIHLISPFRKLLTSRLPRPILYALSHALGFILYSCLWLIYKPINENKWSLRLKHLLPYNDYLYYISRLSYTALVNVVFDHLVPELTHYISRVEFESWFREENLSAVTITSRNNMSWRGQGTRIRSPKTP